MIARVASVEPAIEVRDLRKSYGGLEAVRGIEFTVRRGEIYGLLGPNGAGKTSTVEILEGYRERTSGEVSVLGFDPDNRPRELRARVGIVLQSSGIYNYASVAELLDHFAHFYPHPRDVDEVIDLAGLSEKRDARARTLSGGQRRRLDLALALVGDPELVFLDELTTGLDPHARHAMWDLVRDVRSRGKVVFLTTHFMEEAEVLCDRVAIVDHGKIVALDTPARLIAGLGGGHRVVFAADDDVSGLMQGLEGVRLVEKISQRTIVGGDGDMLVVNVVTALVKAGVRFRDLRTEQPKLEDVFLALTGREMRD